MKVGELFAHYDGRWAAGPRRLGLSRAEAEDVVQDVFVRALELVGELRAATVCGWLQTAMRNRALDLLGRKARKFEQVDDLPHLGDGRLPHETAMIVADALGQVEVRDQDLLAHAETETYDDLSRRLKVPMGTVRSRVARARARAQKAVEDSSDLT